MKITDFAVLDEDITANDVDVSSIVPKSELNPKIWNGSEMIPEVLESATKISENYKNFILKDYPDIAVVDIEFTGSLANYNWSEFSDFDIHLILDFSKINTDTDLVFKYLYDRTLLYRMKKSYTICGYDVELNTVNEPKPKKNAAVFSIMNNSWKIEPELGKIDIDYDKVKEKASSIINMLADARCDLTTLTKIKKKIKNLRQAALDSNGEFATENLAFKLIRRMGYLDRLKKVIERLS